MAKVDPSLTLVNMETELGYKVSAPIGIGNEPVRFYSNLEPVPHDLFQRTRDEYEKLKKTPTSKSNDLTPSDDLPIPDSKKARILQHSIISSSSTSR